jgi:hypothetical protein
MVGKVFAKPKLVLLRTGPGIIGFSNSYPGHGIVAFHFYVLNN